MAPSNRTLGRIYSFILLAVVVLSWSYVIYSSRVAAQWLLEQRTAEVRTDQSPASGGATSRTPLK